MHRIGIEYELVASHIEVKWLLEGINALIENYEGNIPSTVMCLKRDLEDIINE